MTVPWHEDDGMWALLREAIFSSRRWAQAENEVTQLIGLLDLAGNERILDVPCGQGRHGLEFTRRGFAVTGVDRTTAFLDEARRRADVESLEVEFVHRDMRDFVRPDAFDVAINLYTSIGYFEERSDDVQFFQNVYASLAPGGRFVLDLFAKEILAADFRPRDHHHLDDGSILLEQRDLVDGWSRIRNTWTLIRDGVRIDRVFHLRLYSATELRDELATAGFATTTAYGNLDGDPYDEHADRLVVLAKKAGSLPSAS